MPRRYAREEVILECAFLQPVISKRYYRSRRPRCYATRTNTRRSSSNELHRDGRISRQFCIISTSCRKRSPRRTLLLRMLVKSRVRGLFSDRVYPNCRGHRNSPRKQTFPPIEPVHSSLRTTSFFLHRTTIFDHSPILRSDRQAVVYSRPFPLFSKRWLRATR